MNCELCIQELEAYRESRLPEGISSQVKAHLEDCKDCSEVYNLLDLAEKVIDEEKELQSNPFLITRVMAGIDELGQKSKSDLYIPVFQRVLKPVLLSLSVVATIYIGIMAGSVNKPNTQKNEVPVELSYINDAALESVELLATN